MYACTIDIYSCLYAPYTYLIYTFLIYTYTHPARPHDDYFDRDEAHRLGGHQAQDQSAAAGIHIREMDAYAYTHSTVYSQYITHEATMTVYICIVVGMCILH